MAFRRGDVIGSSSVPELVLDVLRQWGVPDTTGIEGLPLQISSAERVSTRFQTDRGLRLLDAWRLTGPQLLGDLLVLDPVVATTLRPPKPFEGARHLEFRAVVDLGTAELDVSFIGGPVDQVDYPGAEVVETDQAVAVIPIAHRRAFAPRQRSRPRAGPVASPAIFRQVRVTLSRPLGGRVLVDFEGSACIVEAPGES